MPPYRRITLAVGLAMFVDAALFLAVLPLLPQYADRFDLGPVGAAVVLGAYPVSMPAVALVGIAMAPRVGPKPVALASAIVMVIATIAFAIAPNAPVLVAARLFQGVASGSIWTASMSWVTHNAPPHRRGREAGIVTGMLAVGSVTGPAIGALAASIGSAPAFLVVAGVSVVCVLATAAAPAGAPVDPEKNLVGSLQKASRQPLVRAALLMVVLDPIAFGTIDLLVPLDLGRRGASTTEIAAAFAIGAAVGAIAGPLGGRLIDRVGVMRIAPIVATGIAVAPLPLAIGLPVNGELALLVVIGPLFSVAAASIYTLSAHGADDAEVAHVVVGGLRGSAWAIGSTIAPLLAGALAASTTPTVAYLVALGLGLPLLVTLAASVRRFGRTIPRRSAETTRALP